MQRAGLIKRRKSIQQYCRERAAKKAQWGDKPKPPAKKQKRGLRRQSVARATDMRLYYQERAVFLQEPRNLACAICLCLGMTPQAATEVHHRNGRIGRLLRYQPFWTPSCRGCREIPHTRPEWAREMGLLCPASEWNVFPRQ